jgi:hypothetical protein
VLGRAIGAHNIHLTHTTPPERCVWASELSVDGLALIQPWEECAVFPYLFEQLDTSTLEHIKIKSVITGVKPLFNGVMLFSMVDNALRELTLRFRSTTFDLGAWNIPFENPDRQRWISWSDDVLQSIKSIEHVHVRNTWSTDSIVPAVMDVLTPFRPI